MTTDDEHLSAPIDRLAAEAVAASVTMDGREWIEAFSARLGVDAPDEATVEALLDIAGVAAHGSERIAAPIACWLIGRAGLGVEEARRVADAVAEPG